MNLLRYSLMITTAIVGILLAPRFTFAVSGTCAWHDGVNCSAGPDWDGSTICNDGWRDSTEKYFSTELCKNQTWCSSTEYSDLMTKFSINSLVNQLIEINNQITQVKLKLDADLIELKEQPITLRALQGQQNILINNANQEISSLTQQASLIIQQLNYAQDNLNRECFTLGYDRQLQRTTELNQRLLELLQTPKCPDGYLLNNNQCITYTEYCINNLGNNFVGVKNEDKISCYCATGYVWDSARYACVVQNQSLTTNNAKNIFYYSNPADLNNLLNYLGKTRNQVEEEKYKTLITQDANEFRVNLNASQSDAITNFVTYGISTDTIILGAGERRAVLRDYLDTVNRADINWEDIRRIVNGQKVVDRNLEKENMQVNNVLKIFKRVFGHDPVFSNAKEDLFWNTLMYRIRFTRDLDKEILGINKFKSMFGYTPKSPLDWATVRGLGYVYSQ